MKQKLSEFQNDKSGIV